MMDILPYLREQLIKIGQHEVAHYIAARCLGFPVGEISIKITDYCGGHEAGSKILLHGGLNQISDLIDYLEKRVIVLYAGVLGESLHADEIDQGYAVAQLSKGGRSDFDKIRELLQVLNKITFPEIFDEKKSDINIKLISDKLWSKASELVVAEKDIITGLGSRLASEIKEINQSFVLTAAEICNLPSIRKRFPEK